MNINKSNSSQEEINKFNALADEWWDPNGGFGSLHSLNPLRFEYINNAAPINNKLCACLLYTSPSPRDRTRSRMPSSA